MRLFGPDLCRTKSSTIKPLIQPHQRPSKVTLKLMRLFGSGKKAFIFVDLLTFSKLVTIIDYHEAFYRY
jgi:hypothetical protein